MMRMDVVQLHDLQLRGTNEGEKRRRLRLVNGASTDVGPRRATRGSPDSEALLRLKNLMAGKTIVWRARSKIVKP